jgi:hypothetical protein
MKVLLLPVEAFKYLEFVFETHLRAGIPSTEVFAAADLKTFLGKAQTVDFSKLGKAEIEKLGPNGVVLNLVPDAPGSSARIIPEDGLD